jgi:hypothetical protein
VHKIVQAASASAAGAVTGIAAMIASFFAFMYLLEKGLKMLGH